MSRSRFYLRPPSTMRGDAIRTMAGDGIVGTCVGDRAAPFYLDPDDARAWAADLARYADEADRMRTVGLMADDASPPKGSRR